MASVDGEGREEGRLREESEGKSGRLSRGIVLDMLGEKDEMRTE